MDRLLTKFGQAGVIDRLFAKYQRLDRDRGQLLKAIDTLMASRGYAKDSRTTDGQCWYGVTHRRYSFELNRGATRLLHRRTALEALRHWCQDQSIEPHPDVIELRRSGRSVQEPLQRGLPLVSPDAGPFLCRIDELNLAEIDALATSFIDEFERQATGDVTDRKIADHDILYFWSDENWYSRGRDFWVDEAWWINQAWEVWRAFYSLTERSVTGCRTSKRRRFCS